MRGYLDRGYNVVKMKIGGAPITEDRERIEAVLKEIGNQAQLAVDANGRFDLETAIAYARMLRDYRCSGTRRPAIPSIMRCRPRSPNSIPGRWRQAKPVQPSGCEDLIRYGGMRPDRDWLQFDCALSYGLCEYQRTLAVLHTHGWSASRCIPHGGHQMSLNIAAASASAQ